MVYACGGPELVAGVGELVGGVFSPCGGVYAFEWLLAKVTGGGEVFTDTVCEVGCQDSGRGVPCRGAGRLDSGPINILSGDFPCDVSVVGVGGLFCSFPGQQVSLVVTMNSCVGSDFAQGGMSPM